MKAAGLQRHKRPHLEHDLHGEDGSEDIIGVTEYLQVKETSVSGDSGVLASVWVCRADCVSARANSESYYVSERVGFDWILSSQ